MFLVDSHRRCLLDWMMRFYLRLKGRYVTCRWRNTWNQFFCSHKHHQQDLFKKICTVYIISLLASQSSRLLCRHHYQKDLFIWSRSPSFLFKKICTVYIISLLASQPSRLLCRHHYQQKVVKYFAKSGGDIEFVLIVLLAFS